MAKHEKCAVILMNMGGPDSLDSVEPFLYNLFMDPDIIEIPAGILLRRFIAGIISRRRAVKVREYYKKIGGKSPLTEITLEQARALEKSLKDEGDFSVHVAMRYWHPFTAEALENVLKVNPSRLILLPLYPQYSATTTGSSLNEFQRAWSRTGRNGTEIRIVRNWYDNDRYIDAWAEKITEALENFRRATPYLIFSAHGIPEKRIRQGDPYKGQTEETVRLILNKLDWSGEWGISYQSRVGPVKWLEPSTEASLEKLGKAGIKNLLMVPISFVSDHSETLYEMDIQYRSFAGKVGIENFHRAASLNSSRSFIAALKDIVLLNMT